MKAQDNMGECMCMKAWDNVGVHMCVSAIERVQGPFWDCW